MGKQHDRYPPPGKAFDNFDFTLNYLYKRADAAAGVEWGAAWDRNQLGPGGSGTGILRPDFPVFLSRGAGGTIDQGTHSSIAV